MRKISGLSLVFCLGLCLTNSGRSDDQDESKGIVKKAIKAAGGKDKLARINAFSAKVKTTFKEGKSVARYTADVCPPKAAVAASVNSVFANAQATAKLTPWANVKIDATKVFECHACGAPQEVALDFVCRYCKSPMTRK